MHSLILSSTLLPILTTQALHSPNNIGKLPALGWSSWNAFGCDVNSTKISQAASLLQSLGLRSAGYEYVNIDDCWSEKSGRDPKTNKIVPNPTTFPDGGIKALADHVHSLDMKLGIYSSAGTTTCAGYPASLGNEDLDAATFAEWGVDYLKYDNCGADQSWYDECYFCDQDSFYNPDLKNGSCLSSAGLCPAGYDFSQCKTAQRFKRMRDALGKVEREVVYSLCEWGINEVWVWGKEVGHSWRTTNDVTANFTRVLNFVNLNSFWTNYGDFYGHNDMDMLEIGNGLTPAESRSHFALWAINKSPLLIGTDLSQIGADDVAILKNKYLLAFHQDPVFGKSGAPYKWGVNPNWTFNDTVPAEYWSGKSGQGTLVAMFNSLNETREMETTWGEIPGLDKRGVYDVVDVWTGKTRKNVRGGLSQSVEAHDIAVYMVGGPCEKDSNGSNGSNGWPWGGW